MTIKTRKHDASITDPDGNILFEKKDFEVPEFWSNRAANIVANKYAMDDENSVLDIIRRVVAQITNWGIDQNYFPIGGEQEGNAECFSDDLFDILINQRASFNSPVWFNIGSDTPTNQASACFIVPVEDTMESILDHNVIEGLIFRGGSGAGCNVSKLRAKGEKLSNKGEASGPLSFMRMWDTTAGVIKSGGKTRRSAKMICMDVDHPDIMDFIECKKLEEDKAKALTASGINEKEAYNTVAFQNTNHSIRVSDEFMRKAENNEAWELRPRKDDVPYAQAYEQVGAQNLLRRTAEIAWATGDPGIQFDDRMNMDNPVPSIDKINSTNPCSEFSAVDNSSCNLASLNLVKYLDDNNKFNYEQFAEDIHVIITAMDILVDAADYPTKEIRDVTTSTRPLGLGFSNLGAMLMIKGIPYDCEEARTLAASITKAMTRAAYRQSIKIAEQLGSYKEFGENIEKNMDIIERLTDDTYLAADAGTKGLRNSQVTLLAPTGTISFMMDCDTTGIEPPFALKIFKQLSGGGTMEIDLPCVDKAWSIHGHAIKDDEDLKEVIENTDDEDLINLFATSNKISWKAHIDMMAACQKHLNGAISKTVNMPANCTVDDIYDAYMYAWKAGIKALAVYRDGSKGMQPMSDANKEKEEARGTDKPADKWCVVRKALPRTRDSITHAFNIGGFEGYLTVGLYEDGNPGEMFINMQKEGSTISGLMDSFAVLLSFALQYGVPLERLIQKFRGTKFDPAGFTDNSDIRMCTSIMDYVFRWLDLEFFSVENDDEDEPVAEETQYQDTLKPVDASGPPCMDCGHTTVLTGTCYQCTNCGANTGCGG